MLIARAEIYGAGCADLRVENGKVTAIGHLAPRLGERVLDLQGGAALPGLNDHHIHLMAYAASLESVSCGPPKVHGPEQMIEALGSASPNQDGWIRGIGYHESVAGNLDRRWLDRHLPDVPIRVQHRSGRLWVVNGAGLKRLARRGADGALPAHDEGRFHDQDEALGKLWGRTPPSVGTASDRLASYGVTGLTDLTPQNDDTAAVRFEGLRSNGSLRQAIRVGGVLRMNHRLTGPTKVHLHDSAFPDFDDLCDLIRASHAPAPRGGGALRHRSGAGVHPRRVPGGGRLPRRSHRTRIDHAAGLAFATARTAPVGGDATPLHRGAGGCLPARPDHGGAKPGCTGCRGFLDCGIPLAGGSDAPFGHADPWRAMRAAVTRQTGVRRHPRRRRTPNARASALPVPGCLG